MGVAFAVLNPSPYPRKGVIEVSLDDLVAVPGFHRDSPVVRDANGRVLDCQIDRLDPLNPHLSFLAVSLRDPVRPGRDDYTLTSGLVSVDLSTPGPPQKTPPSMRVEVSPGGESVLLVNRCLQIALSLGAATDPGAPLIQRWMAGAARSVQIRRHGGSRNVLFGFEDHFHAQGSYPEIRCVQPDRLYITNEETNSVHELDLHDTDYELVTVHGGPVRVGVTIASKKTAEVAVRTQSGTEYLLCRLYRTITLGVDDDFLQERSWVRAIAGGTSWGLLPFRLRYFAFLRWSFAIDKVQYEGQFDWFSIRSRSPKMRVCGENYFPAIGFGSDSHTVRLRTPHPYYPVQEQACHSVAWESAVFSTISNCIYRFFIASEDERCDHYTGECWYEVLFRPLRAKIMGPKGDDSRGFQ